MRLAAVAFVALVLATPAWAHRVTGAPRSLKAKILLAKRQLWHDRAQLAVLRQGRWLLVSPLPWNVLSHQAWLRRDKRYLRSLERSLRPVSVTGIICAVFGPYCSQAIRVASCESHLYTGAQNGQYLGLFQMGAYARSRYGHGPDAWTQARAAYGYFRDSGRDWSPWECKP